MRVVGIDRFQLFAQLFQFDDASRRQNQLCPVFVQFDSQSSSQALIRGNYEDN